ncbi:MAG: STM4012 family radical SAM protein [Filifactor alocis]|nr:STM4012 family radical SAM protein [Filifactor alocis]
MMRKEDHSSIYTQYMYSYPHKRTYEDIERLDLSLYRERFRGREMGLYIHLPFCRSKCGYCNLFSITGEEEREAYLSAVQRHCEQMKCEVDTSETRFTSLVLGGGTPLLLSEKELEGLFVLARDEYRFSFEQDFSVVETSPYEATIGKLNLLREVGVKRVSVGIQSFLQDELRILERVQRSSDMYSSLDKIKALSFEVLNIDLIYGIPGQSVKSLIYSIEEALRFEPEEIFLYPLYKQENARLYHKFEMDFELQYRLYQEGRSHLLEKGYVQNSMRNFSKKRKVNTDCGFENMLSLGCGGRSYFDELHFCEKYVSAQEECRREYRSYVEKKDFLRNISFFLLDEEERKRKYAIKNLLYVTGLSRFDYKERFCSEVEKDFPFLIELCEQGQVRLSDGRWYLTEEGLGFSDRIGPLFMSEKVRKRMKNYA